MKISLKTAMALSFLVLLFSGPVHAAKKAKIIGEVVEVYSEASFDSEPLDEVRKGEVYLVSEKPVGPFHRIKLKSGKIGYIVDYELDIEGRGPLKPKSLDELELLEIRKARANDPNKYNDLKEEEEFDSYGSSLAGPTLQLINYHEDTMGSEQIADLLAVGYRSVGMMMWSAVGTWQAPTYYSKPTDYQVSGYKFWFDFGVSNPILQSGRSEVRLAGNIFSHVSLLRVETPARNYDLHDVTMGLNLELDWSMKIGSVTPDFFVKYCFDKSRYASFGLSLLF